MTDSEFPYQTEQAVADAVASGHVPADHPAIESHEGRHAAQDAPENPDSQDGDGGENKTGMTPATPLP